MTTFVIYSVKNVLCCNLSLYGTTNTILGGGALGGGDGLIIMGSSVVFYFFTFI
jgi:hypothetical protein